MAHAGWVRGVIIAMNWQLYPQPKYAGTFRKMDAGMVNAAGKPVFFFVLFLCVTWWKGKAKRTISFLARSLFCTTRYLHVLQPEAGAAAAGRRSSVPTVSSSSVPYALPNRRRGSEPALLQAELMSRRSEFVVNVSNHQHSVGHRAADIAEEQSQGIGCGNEWNFWSAFLHT